VTQHIYLRPIAQLEALVHQSAVEACASAAPVPQWSEYAKDFRAGVPLLNSPCGEMYFEEVERAFPDFVAALATKPLPLDLNRVIESPGFLRYLNAKMLAWYLGPVIQSFERWRNEEIWLRSYCPTCGSLPAMAQLRGVEPGRLRFLSCGVCRSRWRYRRVGCPFCDNQSEQALLVITVSEEPDLRIDYCDECRGYLKTYSGQGREEVFLADWTSLHIDFAAQYRGLKRLGASQYEWNPQD